MQGIVGRMFAVLGLGVMFCGPASAALPDEIQIYDDEIGGAGERSLEFHANTTLSGNPLPPYPGERVALHALRLTPEFAWGLGHDLEAGLYIPTVSDSSHVADLAGLRGRMKWLPIHAAAGGTGGFAGLNVEYSRVAYRYDAARVFSELRGIAGWRGEHWLLAVNPALGWGFTQGNGGAPDLSLAVKVLRTLSGPVKAGAEYYVGYGRLGQFQPSAERSRTGYGIVELALPREITLSLGVGRGWGGADRWTVKSMLSTGF